jgi:hypothetical protein
MPVDVSNAQERIDLLQQIPLQGGVFCLVRQAERADQSCRAVDNQAQWLGRQAEHAVGSEGPNVPGCRRSEGCRASAEACWWTGAGVAGDCRTGG